MNRFILADPEKCIGCRTCEVACMMSHQSSATPEALTSRIRVVKGETFTTAVGCHQCEDAPCANVCPTGPFTALREPGSLSNRAVSAAKAVWWRARSGQCRFGSWKIAFRR